MLKERLPRRFTAELTVSLLGDLVDGKGVVYDLSTGGGAIRSAVPLSDTPYVCLLIHPPHEDTLIKVEVAAVRWIRGETFGLEFIRMNAEQQKRLRDLVEVLHIAPGLPTTSSTQPAPNGRRDNRHIPLP